MDGGREQGRYDKHGNRASGCVCASMCVSTHQQRARRGLRSPNSQVSLPFMFHGHPDGMVKKCPISDKSQMNRTSQSHRGGGGRGRRANNTL